MAIKRGKNDAPPQHLRRIVGLDGPTILSYEWGHVDMRHETEVRGADEAFIRIRAIPGDVDRQIQNITKEAADVAFGEMEASVPDSDRTGSQEREPHRKIRDSLAVEEVRFAPGGLGGGGFYEVTVGAIDRPPSHFLPVILGSGNFPPNSVFAATGERKNLFLMGYPGNFFMHREGQAAQHEWIDDSIDLANRYVEVAIQTIHIDG